MESQVPKNEANDISAEICLLQTFVNQQEGKISNQTIEEVEANIIFDQIVNLIENKQINVAILYSRLSPSYFLIKKLLSSDFSFVAQSKVMVGEQPILGIVITIIENALGFYADEVLAQRKIQKVVNLLGIELVYKISKDRLLKNLAYFGIEYAILRELDLLGLTLTDKQNVINLISDISLNSADNLEKIWLRLRDFSKDTFSIEFRGKGTVDSKIQIMSVHSSKGLEFDHVILGGIHTNGGSIRNEGLIKKGLGASNGCLSLNQIN